MLIAHMSDLHLGHSQFNLEEREEDVYDAFDQAVDISVREGAKIVILAGDLFHMPKPQGAAMVRFGDALKRLKQREIKTFFVLGEHDISRTRGVPAAFLFHNLGYAYYLKNGEPYEHDNLQLIGFDKYRRSELDALDQMLRAADVRAESFSGKKILVLHQGLSDFNSIAGEINATDLPRNFTYYAMGHYHERYEKRFQVLGGPLAYPGSTEVSSSEGVKETEKGFYLVDLSGEEAKLNWIKLDIRPQIAIKVGYDQIGTEIGNLIEDLRLFEKKPIVSVRVHGRDIDSGVISEQLFKLNEHVLHYVWEPVEEAQQSLVAYDERPRDIDAEMLRMTREVLESHDMAEFAIKELLPLLAENKIDEAFSIAWKAYVNSRFEKKEVKH